MKTMAITSLLSSSSSPIPQIPKQFSPLTLPKFPGTHQIQTPTHSMIVQTQKGTAAIAGVAGFAAMSAALVGPAFAADLPLVGSTALQLTEPSNALSLPTWAIHVSSVVEWITAMALVWQYGDKSGYESWKGLSWGMAVAGGSAVELLAGPANPGRFSPGKLSDAQVPLLGGAFCACTWHFFYNAESLEVLVALQGALTVIGNITMCIAAFRIYKSSQESSDNI